jgi:DNA-binding PadR family transcriptional regulator
LNLKKHKPILEDIEHNELIERREATIGKRTVTIYKPTQKGMAFCRDILEPYEKMFPRRKDEIKKREENATAENEKKVNTDLIMLVLI